MVAEKMKNVEVTTKANVYWEGKVTSRTFFRENGSKFTLGIITAGSYTFDVGDREVVQLIAGRCGDPASHGGCVEKGRSA